MSAPREERVIVITGGSRNIGFATATALVARGYKLGILARSAESVAEAAQKLGPDVLPIALDVTDRNALFAAFEQVATRFGRIDGLVNNAGVAHLGKVEHLDPVRVIEQVNLNFVATVFGCQGIIPHLRRQGGGRIVNVSSAASRVEVFSHLSIYAATKAAVDRFSDELRHEMYGENIGVTTFVPGDTTTSFGFGWDPKLISEAYAIWQERGDFFAGSMDVDTVGEGIAHCFDLPVGAAYDLVVLRPVGRIPKAMLPES